MDVDLAKLDYICRKCGWRKDAETGTRDVVFSGGKCPSCGANEFGLVKRQDSGEKPKHT